MTQDARSRFDSAAELFRARHIERAIVELNEAERCGFSPDECAAARWECWMLLGRFDRAWAESDAIALRGAPDPNRLWDGQPFTDKRVIVRCLHGLGDTIQFIRYAPLIRKQAREVIVQAHPEIVRLLRFADGIDQAVTWGAEPNWDSQIEVNELPRIFRTLETSIPCELPYLNVPHEMFSDKHPSNIGLVWNASAYNSARSIPFHLLFEALAGIDGKLLCLQFKPESNPLDLTPLHGGDLLDATIDTLNLDLIITVDTMNAHLAGALGKPVWVLLPFEADWRWMLDRVDSPWYPTMRLFRQTRQGDWTNALRDLRRAALTLSCHTTIRKSSKS